MGNINIGNQLNTFRYEHPASSTEFNAILHKLISTGVYEGGLVSKISDSLVRINPTVIVISDPSENVTIRCETTLEAEVSVSETNNYIIMRLTWLPQINNYVDIISVAEGDLLEKDIILAKANFDVGVLINFDYSVKTTPLFEQIQKAITTEIYNREQADLALQDNIDEKFNVSDMINVGGTGSENKGILTNSLGYIDRSFFTDLFFTNIFDVANQAEMLDLVAEQGDIARRSDEQKTYFLSAGDPSVLENWKVLLYPVSSVAGRTGEIILVKDDVGLSEVDNTSDLDKPVSTATALALSDKANIEDLALKLDKASRENIDANISNLGIPKAGISENVSRSDHTHDVFLPFEEESISGTKNIPIGQKVNYTLTDDTTFDVDLTNFRENKENWFDIGIYNPDLYFVTFPSNWKWVNNLLPPIGEPYINLIGWSFDSINWNVGYIVIGS